MKKASSAECVEEIVTIRIELAGSEPLIWREVEVPTSITLGELHTIVQYVMNWEDDHLWEFTIGKERFGLNTGDSWDYQPKRDADMVRLRDVLKPRRTKIQYLYDFGDSWEHSITVTKVRQGEPGAAYPRYIGGENNAPPEDCGGLYGFYNLLDAVGDPAHPDHNYAAEWFEDYDPKHVDASRIKQALGAIVAHRRAVPKGRGQQRASRQIG